MDLFWRKGSSKTQKIVASLLFATMLGPLVSMFTHNFVTAPSLSKFAIYSSGLLTFVSLLSFFYLYKKESWKPASAWYNYSKVKKVMLIPFVPFFIFGLFWINLAISLPHLYTSIFGHSSVLVDVVAKDKNYSRRSCDYRLEPKSVDAPFFHYCISESLYNHLPEKEIDAELIIKQSSVGYIVKNILLENVR